MSSFLWLTWKDHAHPEAGGAEVVLRELSRRLVRAGHQVTWLTCGYAGATKFDRLDGIRIIRVGTNRYTHNLQALAYFARRLRNNFDYVIEVVNTAPYFSVFFGHRAKRFLFYHQLAREIWHYETRPPLSYAGYYVIEPASLRLLASSKVPVLTISESTKAELQKFGFDPMQTHVISEGLEIEPAPKLHAIRKFDKPTMLSFGTVRAMKRTLDQIEAFELAKLEIPNLQLKIAGNTDSEYGQQVVDYTKGRHGIEVLGRVSTRNKIRLMSKSHVTLQTSLKEGWGLTITEAASQGTPAIAYNVDGLRDSIRDGVTGIITDQNPKALAKGIVKILRNLELYNHMRQAAWEWSKQITFDQSFQDFKRILELP